MVHYAQTLDLAELRQADLNSARHAVTALESERRRLREELGRMMPAEAGTPNGGTPNASGPENRTDQVAHAALAIVHRQYAQPLTLKLCARRLGLNAACLSALLSRAVGVPFKAYLTELRLQKARELLADPNRHVSEVAGAVGYSSDNRFRLAFKKATGFLLQDLACNLPRRRTFLPRLAARSIGLPRKPGTSPTPLAWSLNLET